MHPLITLFTKISKIKLLHNLLGITLFSQELVKRSKSVAKSSFVQTFDNKSFSKNGIGWDVDGDAI